MTSDLWVISFGTEFSNTAWEYNFRLYLFTYQMENNVNSKKDIK